MGLRVQMLVQGSTPAGAKRAILDETVKKVSKFDPQYVISFGSYLEIKFCENYLTSESAFFFTHKTLYFTLYPSLHPLQN